MGNRLSKIYTRTGDDGTTGLGDGSRVPKDSVRVEAYGTVDELNSAVGVLLAVPGLPPAITACLTEVQHQLFDLGGELCIPGHSAITAAHVTQLEQALDVVLGLPEGQPRLRQLIDVRRCLNMQLRVQAHRLRRHGPLQRLSGVSLPGVAQGKDSEAEIEYNTEPEPHRVFRTLHAADAP